MGGTLGARRALLLAVAVAPALLLGTGPGARAHETGRHHGHGWWRPGRCEPGESYSARCGEAREAYYSLLALEEVQRSRLERARREANRVEARNAERQLERLAGKIADAKARCDRAAYQARHCGAGGSCRPCTGYGRGAGSGAAGAAESGGLVGEGGEEALEAGGGEGAVDPETLETVSEILDAPLFGGDGGAGGHYEDAREGGGTSAPRQEDTTGGRWVAPE